jgi:hypothetical protein
MRFSERALALRCDARGDARAVMRARCVASFGEISFAPSMLRIIFRDSAGE